MKKIGLFLLAVVMVVGSASSSQAVPNLLGIWSGSLEYICIDLKGSGSMAINVRIQDGSLLWGDWDGLPFSGTISGTKVQLNITYPDDRLSYKFLDGTYAATTPRRIKGTYRDFFGCSGKFFLKK